MYKKCYDLLVPGGKFMTVVFDKKTTGYGTGTEIEPGSYEGIQVGPIQGLGIRHFFDYNELKQSLYNSGFEQVRVETLCYSDNGNSVSQLMGFCEKGLK